MRRRVLMLVAACVLVAAEGKEGASARDQERLQGAWAVESATRGGKKAPAERIKAMRMVIEGDRMTVKDGTRDETATFTLMPDQKPAAIDIRPNRPGEKTVRGIYRIAGDTLTMCWVREGDRPKELASKEGSGAILLVLKRQKK